jgi:hypothetical protein
VVGRGGEERNAVGYWCERQKETYQYEEQNIGGWII